MFAPSGIGTGGPERDMVAISGREYAIFLAIAAFIVGVPMLRRFRRDDAAKRRAEVLPRIGFAECTREQVFGAELKAFAYACTGDRLGAVSSWVGKGSSALGETLIFDLRTDINANGPDPTHTVIAFRVSGPLAYFDITHMNSISRLANRVAGDGPGTTPAGAPLFIVPLASAAHPDLARQYRVVASDLARMQAALTPAFVDALGRIDGHNLHIQKSGTDWLLFQRYATYPLSPQDYPAMLKQAVSLLSLLDLGGGAS